MFKVYFFLPLAVLQWVSHLPSLQWFDSPLHTGHMSLLLQWLQCLDQISLLPLGACMLPNWWDQKSRAWKEGCLNAGMWSCPTPMGMGMFWLMTHMDLQIGWEGEYPPVDSLHYWEHLMLWCWDSCWYQVYHYAYFVKFGTTPTQLQMCASYHHWYTSF